jgi:hypothetical protein
MKSVINRSLPLISFHFRYMLNFITCDVDLCEFRHVIMVLSELANGKQKHVPYRDSRLTFLLQVNTYSHELFLFYSSVHSFL